MYVSCVHETAPAAPRAPRAPRLSTRTPPPEDTLAGPLGLAVAPCTAQVHVQSASQSAERSAWSSRVCTTLSAPARASCQGAYALRTRVATGARLYLFKSLAFNQLGRRGSVTLSC